MRRIRIYSDNDGMSYRRHEHKFRHDPELREAYECGLEDGRSEAEGDDFEMRRGTHYGAGGRILYRHGDYDPYMERRGDDGYDERRRRDSRGRYM